MVQGKRRSARAAHANVASGAGTAEAAGPSAGASPAASPAVKRFKYRQYEERQFWVACADLKQQERLYKARKRHHEPSQREACEAASFPRTTFITWWIKLQCSARSEEECIAYAAGQPWPPPQQQSPVAQAVAALEAEARMEEASPARVAMQAHPARQAPMSPTVSGGRAGPAAAAGEATAGATDQAPMQQAAPAAQQQEAELAADGAGAGGAGGSGGTGEAARQVAGEDTGLAAGRRAVAEAAAEAADVQHAVEPQAAPHVRRPGHPTLLLPNTY